ncbi:MAG TPA: outer membrane beta-barrel protein [Xanthobacteraceae bacterium]|jgi:outer membrane immunogenic protein|nr:outer membrane beta-barrel protein [Xanthobacteraceae bacterium]
MKKIAFGLIALLSTFGTSAFAADMASPGWVGTGEPVRFTWTGFYVGGIAGAAISRPQTNLTVTDGIVVPGGVLYYPPGNVAALQNLGSVKSSDPTGAFGGRIGYNYQAGAYVWGIEGDITSIRSKISRLTTGNPFAGCAVCSATFNSTTKTDWVSTVRGRWGMPVDRVMLYATGGVAFGKVSFTNSYFGVPPNVALGLTDSESSSASKTMVGWTIGGGFDYTINTHWVISLDYEHIDLGNLKAAGTVIVSNPTVSNSSMNFSTHIYEDIVSAGLGYKF